MQLLSVFQVLGIQGYQLHRELFNSNLVGAVLPKYPSEGMSQLLHMFTHDFSSIAESKHEIINEAQAFAEAMELEISLEARDMRSLPIDVEIGDVASAVVEVRAQTIGPKTAQDAGEISLDRDDRTMKVKPSPAFIREISKSKFPALDTRPTYPVEKCDEGTDEVDETSECPPTHTHSYFDEGDVVAVAASEQNKRVDEERGTSDRKSVV